MAMALMDELVEAILLRVPPDDPACLVHAALVCKGWRNIISNVGFHHRYHQLHHTPPMLGFFRNHGTISSFVPTGSFRLPRAARRNFPFIDARHGRVLLHNVHWESGGNPLVNPFVVWDPITGERRELPLLPWSFDPYSWNAAVLCASAGACDHLDCCHGPFLVVLVGTGQDRMFAYVYSSETAEWSEEASAHYPGDDIILAPSNLVGNAHDLNFMFWYSEIIMKFDLGTREITVIQVPPKCSFRRAVLITTEDGGLGFAYTANHRLYIWSMESGPDVGWAQSRVIELETLLPVDALLDSLDVADFAEGATVIFLRTDKGVFTIDLKSCRVARVCGDGWYYGNIPYMSFCIPALRAASTVEETTPSTSNV